VASIIPPGVAALPGGALCDEQWIYFVHGTALTNADVRRFNRAKDLGGGDFGKGFYAYELCDTNDRLSIEAAIARSKQKHERLRQILPYRSGQVYRYVVYVKMQRSTYTRLHKHLVKKKDAKQVYDVYAREEFMNVPIIFGPVLYDQGRQIHYDLPRQVKFERQGTRSLEVHEIYQLAN